MESFPYHHSEGTSRTKRRKLLPIAAAGLVGLAVGSGLSKEAPKRGSASPEVATQGVPNCQPQEAWQGLPAGVNRNLLAGLLGVDVGQALTAEMAAVKCDQGLIPGQALKRQIEVAGQDGPCLAFYIASDQQPSNPIKAYRDIIAVCAGPEPPSNQIIA